MKIINESGWRTSDLRKLLIECFRQAGMTHRYGWKNMHNHIVVVRQIDGHEYSGLGVLNGRWIRVNVPATVRQGSRIAGLGDTGNRYEKIPVQFNSIKFAHTTLHELAHNRGIIHKEMTDSLRWRDGWENYVAWAKDFVVRPIAEKPKQDPKELRYQKALAKVSEYQTKLKRTKTILRKWEKRVTYYNKKQAENECQ